MKTFLSGSIHGRRRTLSVHNHRFLKSNDLRCPSAVSAGGRDVSERLN